MPTIPTFTESANRLPESPAATDIRPDQFGKDASALSQLGGTIGEFGSNLMEVRKRAIESDAVASAQTDAMLKFSKIEDEARTEYQQKLAASGGKAIGMSGMAEGVKSKYESLINEQMKSMPTGDAQSAFLERLTPIATRSYLGNVDWENQTRGKAIIGNIDQRANLASQDIYNHPSLSKTFDHVKSLKADLDSQVGSSLDAETARRAFEGSSRKYVGSLFEGLANGTKRDAEYGRELLKNPPKELASFLDAQDIQKLSNRFDQADRERKQQEEINLSAQKQALRLQRDKAQDEILADIYEGRANVNDILRGKGAVLDPDKKQTMLGILKARQNEPKMPSQERLRDVVSRIYAEDGDPRKITSEDQVLKMYTKGDLTWDQKQKALGELKTRTSPEGQIEGDLKKQLFKQAEGALVKKNITGMVDPDGQAGMAKFMSYALTEIEAQKKAGKPVRELLDANSKSYLGNAINNYRKSPAEIMKATAERMKNQQAALRSVKEPTRPTAPVAQPKDTVLMTDPSGKRFYVPKANADKARSRGFKDFDGERSPQSEAGGESGWSKFKNDLSQAKKTISPDKPEEKKYWSPQDDFVK